jgi:hypothetical protein
MILINSALALLYVASSNMPSQSQAHEYDPKIDLAMAKSNDLGWKYGGPC